MSGDDADTANDESHDGASGEEAGSEVAVDGTAARDGSEDGVGAASDVVTGRTSDSGDGEGSDSTAGENSEDDAGESPEFTGSGDSESEEAAGDREAPLSSLASSVSERRVSPDDGPDDELFDEEDVPEIDADAVWERLEEDDPVEVPGDSERDVRVIAKRSYCEQCPYFSTPPDVGCGHEGTEILELVDMEHFRVVDCPKVLEDERLERL